MVAPILGRSGQSRSAGRTRRVDIPSAASMSELVTRHNGEEPEVTLCTIVQRVTASSVNQTVTLPRWRRAASYAAQSVTRCRCLGMWWRRAALASNGTAGIRGSWKGPLPYATRSPGATRVDPCNKVRSALGRFEAELDQAPDGIRLRLQPVLKAVVLDLLG